MKKILISFLMLVMCLALWSAPGEWRSLGSGSWILTVGGTTLNGRLYTAESSGYLYETNLSNGQWKELNSSFENTTFMFSWNDWLYTIERDGSLYRVSPEDGSWIGLGAPGDWQLTIAGVMHNGKLYTAESSGYLYETDIQSGRWREISQGYGNTRFMFSSGSYLYTIENDGSLYQIDPQDGSWKQVGPTGAWELTLAGAVVNGRLYTAESTGYLYWTDLETGQWTEISPGYENTVYMFSANGLLYTIERDGSLYEIQVE